MILDFNRRQFLTLSGAGVLSAACPVISLAEESVAGADYTLLMQANAVSVLPNTLTPAFTFNGSVPAPTLRLKQAVPIRIVVINKLK
jgi:FtsP/CotA-like multicopper oxidase with cupredoxin domain